ncbi:ABA4-like family protein [Pelomonas sp. SE-A7]|uniref:ABA4-like family protein n=1 Tax=Pelomonas sp. SE-A7 TaxID=3054953 RepID=UPI00259C6CA0|nr:ABA4-like family protein [Pelomonas sp. SE-A7]MDM4766234.1 ABA4-like family protein [Pelomonas sp. SE-A7]
MNLDLWLDPARVFAIGNGLAPLGWLLLVASPYRASWSRWARLVSGRVLPLLLAVAYVALFLHNGMGDGGYGSLDEVRRLLAQPALLTAGWLHYLAFDLFVGSWIAERGGAMGLPHWLIVPLLLLSFLFGPAGLLAFALLRGGWLRWRGAAAGSLATEG